jgi:hypothetical protein
VGAVRTFLPAGWREVAAALCCGAVIAGATACGGTGSAKPTGDPLAGLTAAQIASRAISDLKAVSSVHVSGSGKDSGSTVTVDLRMGTTSCIGTLGISDEGSFQLLKAGSTLWVKPDDRFWKYANGHGMPSSVMGILSGKYIRTSPKNSSLHTLEAFCNPRQFAALGTGHPKGLAKGAVVTIMGQPAVPLKDLSDSSIAYVTDSAQPRFLRVLNPHGGRLDFTDYNVPITVPPPPASETIDGAGYGF